MRFLGFPNVGLPAPPPAHPAATDITDNPTIKMTVPVTKGGKNRRSLENDRRQQHREQAAGDHGAVDGGDAVFAAERDHRGDGGEGAVLHQGQAGTEAPESDGLDEGGDPRHEQISTDQVGEVARFELSGLDQRPAHDQRITRQHRRTWPATVAGLSAGSSGTPGRASAGPRRRVSLSGSTIPTTLTAARTKPATNRPPPLRRRRPHRLRLPHRTAVTSRPPPRLLSRRQRRGMVRPKLEVGQQVTAWRLPHIVRGCGSVGDTVAGHWAVQPPSTMTRAPVMKLAAGLARKVMTSAISSGCPIRPRGCWLPKVASISRPLSTTLP